MHFFKLNKLMLAASIATALNSTSIAQAAITYNLNAVNPDEDENSLCGAFGGACPGNGTSAGPWTGAGNPGYTGKLPATWIATIENAGGVAASETASSASAGFRIDMGARAYKDGATNWGHTTDFGLFTLQHDAEVTISVSSDSSVLRPAFGLWQGWATTGNRHQTWLNNGAFNPMGSVFTTGTSLTVIDPNAWSVAASQGTTNSNVTATLTRFLTAGNYTLLLGGYDTTSPGAGPEFKAYSATITAAPVPVPAAAWLFGSALAGFGAIRRKHKASI